MFTGSQLPESSTGTAINGEIELQWEHFPTGGEPLLLINGLSSPRVAYDLGFILEMAHRGFDVVRFDNRDAGKSTSTNGGYGLGDMAADAVAVMDAVGWGTCHIFGMSMGGMIVQQLGIQFPERLRTMTSLMSRTGNPDYGAATPEAMEALMMPAPEGREAWLDQRVFTESIWGSPEASNAELARAKGETLFDYGMNAAGVVHQYKAIVASGRRDEALSQVQVPTLVMHGSADTLITPEGGMHTAEVIPNAKFVLLEGMGHDLPEFYWSQIADAVASLVAEAGFGQS